MQRKRFIQIGTIGLIGVSTSSFSSILQSQFSKDDLMGKSHPVFFGNGYRLRADANKAFLEMKSQAAKDNIKIKVVSSYRNYAHQNRIWERKYKKFTANGLPPLQAIKKIIEYSTIPGTSRHHWGTDLDMVDGNVVQPKNLLLDKNFHGEGSFCKFKGWMDQYATNFGYHLVYTDQKGRKGFKYEPWHYSYAPLSIPMLKAYQELDIKTELEKAALLGNANFTPDFIQKYINENILDINPKLR